VETNVAAVRDSVFAELRLSENEQGGFARSWLGSGDSIQKYSPIDGTFLARIHFPVGDERETIVSSAVEAFHWWRKVPAPKRGEVVRLFAERLRQHKRTLGQLVTLESGKIAAEAEGEVQEMIDICDFAVGLSRQLHGLSIASERPEHRLLEQWHPLGIVGVISAFNFPVAVWSWNAALSAVCGNSTIWKPSEKTPLTAVACIRLAEQVCRENKVDPAVFTLLLGGREAGEALAADPRIGLLSATGSVRMGKNVNAIVAERLGRVLLELGGNNAVVVTPSADLRLVVRAILFGAVGTAGQRCTTTRRLIVHESIREPLVRELISAYEQVRIGNPLEPDTLVGPLIDTTGVKAMSDALETLRQQGGEILYGGERLSELPGGLYVRPSLVRARNDWDIVQQETFAPILYVIDYHELDEAIQLNNNVRQGLSSAIFSSDLRETERFLSAVGSDCGIANVNTGTSGAEIGGAFGGEKETGGGRESGSDAWKTYMRRQTVTINYSSDLPLAQGIKF
jgi:aldehyde dehydrogenase (NAD+)